MSEEDCWVQWVDSVMKLSHPYRPVWTLALLLWFTLQLLHCDISAHATQGVPNQYQSDIKVCILEEIKDVIEKGKTPLKATPKEAQTCDRMNNVCIIQWRDDPPPPSFTAEQPIRLTTLTERWSVISHAQSAKKPPTRGWLVPIVREIHASGPRSAQLPG